MKPIRFIPAVLLLALALAVVPAVTAAPPATTPPVAGALADDGRALEASSTATVVTANSLTFDYIRRFAKFEGSVVVNDPRLQIRADRLTILFSDDGGVQSIKAEGKVLLQHEDIQARADVATYDIATGRIMLVGGPPQVLKDRNILEGDVIIYWRDEQRLECKPHARLVAYPDDFGDASAYFNAPRTSAP